MMALRISAGEGEFGELVCFSPVPRMGAGGKVGPQSMSSALKDGERGKEGGMEGSGRKYWGHPDHTAPLQI